MDKLIPDPPQDPTTPLDEAIRADDFAKNREAIKRALDFYLCPEPEKPRQPSTMFLIHPKIDTESLLAHACESWPLPTRWPVILPISLAGPSAIRRWRFSRSSCWLNWR